MSSLLLAACLVIGVSDGDSIRVKCPERTAAFPVRLAAIDAPELKHTGFVRTSYQPWANESRAALSDLCLKETVDIQRIGFDRNKRAIGFVLCKGHDASVQQVAGGHAWSFLPPKGYGPTFLELEKRARDDGKGLWSLPNPIRPSDWRKAGACAA